MMIDDLNLMYYFAKVAELGSFTAAGAAVGLSTSVMSRRISELERQVGVRLLNRNTRAVSLSEAGRRFYERCKFVVEEARAAWQDMEETSGSPLGLVRVCCPLGYVQSQISEPLARYVEQHPQVRIDLEVTSREVDLVEEGFDIALCVRVPPLQSTQLVMRQLMSGESVLVASRWCVAANGLPADLDDLARMPTLAWANGAGRHVWHLQRDGGPVQAVSHVPKLVCNDLEALRDAALRGLGVALLPSVLVQDHLDDGSLVRLLPDCALPLALYATVHSRRGMRPAVRGVLDCIVEHFEGLGAPSHAVPRAESMSPVFRSIRLAA